MWFPRRYSKARSRCRTRGWALEPSPKRGCRSCRCGGIVSSHSCVMKSSDVALSSGIVCEDGPNDISASQSLELRRAYPTMHCRYWYPESCECFVSELLSRSYVSGGHTLLWLIAAGSGSSGSISRSDNANERLVPKLQRRSRTYTHQKIRMAVDRVSSSANLLMRVSLRCKPISRAPLAATPIVRHAKRSSSQRK